MANNVSLTWTVPFSLDVPSVDDISGYCLSVVNLTSSSTLFSQCGITETEYSYAISPPEDVNCHAFSFTVTAVNIVGNGEPNTVVYQGAPECTLEHGNS